jgi:hypothetical protein
MSSQILCRFPLCNGVTTAFFWATTQRVAVIPYRRFGTAYRSHIQVSRIQGRPLKMVVLKRR